MYTYTTETKYFDWLSRSEATCTPVRTCVLGKECEFITSANVYLILQKAGHAIGQQNVRWKLEDWIRASICTATLLFSQPFFAFTAKRERANFKHCTCVKILPTPQQTVIFILILIQCVLAFKYPIPLKLGLFYFAFSIDTWPYLFRFSLAFACDLRRRSGCQTTSAPAWESDKKPLTHNAIVRLCYRKLQKKNNATVRLGNLFLCLRRMVGPSVGSAMPARHTD